MIRFLLKGILNDRSRSLLPIIVVTLGTFLTVLLHGWITGIMGESLVLNAHINTGHMKVMTRAYAADAAMLPNDLALTDTDTLLASLKKDYPDADWVQRIRFGALADVPDSVGETKEQGPVAGWALDLFSPESKESSRFNLEKILVKGKVPSNPGEALMSAALASRFGIEPGQVFTLFGTTMDGSMAFSNYTLSGTVMFGAQILDKGAVIIDISDAQNTFGMENAAGEILGFLPVSIYDADRADEIKTSFNAKFVNADDIYAPQMLTLLDQEGMGDIYNQVQYLSALFVLVFVAAMSIVLWNSGILGGLRRYTEFGVRLALGEAKWHVFKTLLWEGFLIGFIGSVFGTILGLAVSYTIYKTGINFGSMMQNATLLMPTVVRTVVTPTAFYIGFIPGVFSMVLGNALAGRAIFKRSTARLFNELEV